MNIVRIAKLLLVAFSLLLTSCDIIYQKKLPGPYVKQINAESLSAKLDSLMSTVLAEDYIPGISISVIGDTNVVLSKSFGVRDVKAQTIVNDETVFEFASLGKPVIALAVLQLSAQGVIDLDRPLHEYHEISEFDSDKRHKLITARIILSHTTGLPNWNREKTLQLAFAPGERFQYSGLGYYYLQIVLEKLTGKPLQQIIEEEVFLPLKMTNSSFVWNNKFSNNMAIGHSSKGAYSREIRKLKQAVSASSLLSSAKDYAKFLSYILKEYRKENPVVKRMVTPVTLVKNDGDWGQLSWGLGWGIEETPDGENIWHWGNNSEFRSLAVANLDNGIGLVYVANGASGLKPIADIIQTTIGGIHPLTRFRSVH